MIVLLVLENGDVVKFGINEVGVLGTAEYYRAGQNVPAVLNPTQSDVEEWLSKAKVVDISFRDDGEKRALISNLMELLKLRRMARHVRER